LNARDEIPYSIAFIAKAFWQFLFGGFYIPKAERLEKGPSQAPVFGKQRLAPNFKALTATPQFRLRPLGLQ
jgi:hypothetical protein